MHRIDGLIRSLHRRKFNLVLRILDRLKNVLTVDAKDSAGGFHLKASFERDWVQEYSDTPSPVRECITNGGSHWGHFLNGLNSISNINKNVINLVFPCGRNVQQNISVFEVYLKFNRKCVCYRLTLRSHFLEKHESAAACIDALGPFTE